MANYVDVHAHLIHPQFSGEEDFVLSKCQESGLEYIVCNGLEPTSNRATLALSERHRSVLPALGIYPLDAACNVLEAGVNWLNDFPPPEKFDVDKEIEFIDAMAAEKRIAAVGECGLDKHYVKDDVSLNEQERVLRKLMKVAKKHDIPIILHSRKAESKVLELLLEEGVTKADFHCFCGKANLAKKIADHGYYLSIPAAVEYSESFQKLVKLLPIDKLLTETDCPYMGPDKVVAITAENSIPYILVPCYFVFLSLIPQGVRNDPSNVVRGIAAMAAARGITVEEMRCAVRENFRTLFAL